MAFEFLKLTMRIHKGILIIQSCHQAQRNPVFIHAVDKSAPIGVTFMGIAQRMNDVTGVNPAFRYLPDLFYTQDITRRVLSLVQIEFFYQILRQITP